MQKLRQDKAGWLLGFSVLMSAGAIAAQTHAEIDLTLMPVNSVVNVGDLVEIRVYVSSDSDRGQLMSAMQMIFSWATPYLQLTGNHQVGAVGLLASFFPDDPYGINETIPPQDGEGLYQAIAPLGNPITATPRGTLLTTLTFNALAATSETLIDIVPSAGSPEGHTVIYDGTMPGLDVAGVFTPTTITIVPTPGVFGVVLMALLGGVARRRRAFESAGETRCMGGTEPLA